MATSYKKRTYEEHTVKKNQVREYMESLAHAWFGEPFHFYKLIDQNNRKASKALRTFVKNLASVHSLHPTLRKELDINFTIGVNGESEKLYLTELVDPGPNQGFDCVNEVVPAALDCVDRSRLFPHYMFLHGGLNTNPHGVAICSNVDGIFEQYAGWERDTDVPVDYKLPEEAENYNGLLPEGFDGSEEVPNPILFKCGSSSLMSPVVARLQGRIDMQSLQAGAFRVRIPNPRSPSGILDTMVIMPWSHLVSIYSSMNYKKFEMIFEPLHEPSKVQNFLVMMRERDFKKVCEACIEEYEKRVPSCPTDQVFFQAKAVPKRDEEKVHLDAPYSVNFKCIFGYTMHSDYKEDRERYFPDALPADPNVTMEHFGNADAIEEHVRETLIRAKEDEELARLMGETKLE